MEVEKSLGGADREAAPDAGFDVADGDLDLVGAARDGGAFRPGGGLALRRGREFSEEAFGLGKDVVHRLGFHDRLEASRLNVAASIRREMKERGSSASGGIRGGGGSLRCRDGMLRILL